MKENNSDSRMESGGVHKIEGDKITIGVREGVGDTKGEDM